MKRDRGKRREPDEERGLTRRDAVKALGAAAGVLGGKTERRNDGKTTQQPPRQPAPAAKQAPAPAGGPRGGPWDPDLLHPKPGSWPRLLSAREIATLSVLCDTIIPADEHSPAASTVGVPAYINEVVSAPYDPQQRDLVRVRGGLAWLNNESRKRFGKQFAGLAAAERTRICDDICFLPNAKPEFQAAARFFDLVRDLSATAFYTTREGMADLKYIGNVALPKFEGPPKEVLEKLGLL
jgi:hypothetical protein